MIRYTLIPLLLMRSLVLCVPAEAEPSRILVGRLQRTLKNGCNERRLIVDGILGPQTLRAYRRCREAFGFEETEHLGREEDIRAFTEELWNRKLALILLHQLAYLQASHSLRDREAIAQALTHVSSDQGFDPPLTLRSHDLARLYRWYIEHPPEGSLAAKLKEHRLPSTGLEVFLQVFKKEQEVVIFARRDGHNEDFVRLKAFEIMGSPFIYPPNGSPHRAGPKTVQGDRKVPEGCYTLTFQNEWSDFYLGYLLSYPNRGDQIRRNYWNVTRSAGGSIVLHGRRATIGCIPIGNPGIEELYLLLSRNWKPSTLPVQIHIFPCRFEEENEEMLASYGQARHELTEFWGSLRLIYHYFKQHRRTPRIGFSGTTGYYVIEE